MSAARLSVNREYLLEVLVDLLEIPSPSGRTDHVMQYIGERLAALGVDVTLTRRGAIQATLPGRRPGPGRGGGGDAAPLGCGVAGV